ncbi:MAG: peptidase domain-containing ABC transporter [Ignavibacteria bacterium]|jgi:ABC-type bacteriocin/lantibiotic exporter with double-glycine peptidase domain
MHDAENSVPSLREALKQFKELLLLIKPYWLLLLKTAIPVPFISSLEMISPFLTKMLIDEVYPSKDVSLMHVIVGGVFAVSVSASLLKGIREYYSLYINTKLNNVINLLFFNHIQHLNSRFFDNHQVGEITSRFQDVNSSLGSISHIFSTLFSQGFYLLIVPPFLLLLNWKLALIGLISVPITVLITFLAGKLMRKYWKKTAEAYADYSAFQVEMLSQIRTLKTMALEYFVYKKSKTKVEHALKQNLTSEGISQLLGIVNTILYAANTALFMWLGWTLILSQEMTLGDYIAFTMYVGYLYSPFNQLVYMFSNFQHSAVNLNRMFEYLDKIPEQQPVGSHSAPKEIQHKIKGDIKFESVFFTYDEKTNVLDDITLEINSGKILSIIGPSGSGKTTLLKLVSSIEKPTQGVIYIDSMLAEEIPLIDLRRQMGVVLQEFNLFKGTIWENLTFGQNGIDKSQVDEVIRMCKMDELINSLSGKYNTQVAEWGATLSGGQRQRLAIARAVLRNTPILILDEPTSNIDVQTESKILKGLFEYCRQNNKTVIIVTHRITSAKLADQICFLESGKVAGIGTHEELLNNSPAYSEIYLSSQN